MCPFAHRRININARVPLNGGTNAISKKIEKMVIPGGMPMKCIFEVEPTLNAESVWYNLR